MKCLFISDLLRAIVVILLLLGIITAILSLIIIKWEVKKAVSTGLLYRKSPALYDQCRYNLLTRGDYDVCGPADDSQKNEVGHKYDKVRKAKKSSAKLDKSHQVPLILNRFYEFRTVGQVFTKLSITVALTMFFYLRKMTYTFLLVKPVTLNGNVMIQ